MNFTSSTLRYLARRASFLLVVGLFALALAGSASSATAEQATTASATATPIKIGVILPYTGAFGLYGKPMEETIRARFARNKNRAGKRPIQLFFEDDATDPRSAVLKATKLLTENRVNVVICCVSGASTLAVGPILSDRKIPQLGPIPNPTGLEKYSTAAVAAPTAEHDAELLGRYAARRLGYKSAVILASDFSYGREIAKGFEKGFEAYGGRASKQIFPPLGTQDFGSYLAQIGNPDVVFGGFGGADAIAFVNQYKRFGVRAPLVGHGPLVTELLLRAMRQAAVGIGAGFYYSSQINNATNQDFKRYMTARNSEFVPSHFTAGAWTSATVLIDSINRLQGRVANGTVFAKAIRATNILAPWGRLTFDPRTGYGRAPTYYYKVVENNGTVEHQIIAKLAG